MIKEEDIICESKLMELTLNFLYVTMNQSLLVHSLHVKSGVYYRSRIGANIWQLNLFRTCAHTGLLSEDKSHRHVAKKFRIFRPVILRLDLIAVQLVHFQRSAM